jgi:hypothetical protein
MLMYGNSMSDFLFGYFYMANAIIGRRHLSAAEMVKAVWIVKQRDTCRDVSVALGVHHTIIIRAMATVL